MVNWAGSVEEDHRCAFLGVGLTGSSIYASQHGMVFGTVDSPNNLLFSLPPHTLDAADI